MKTKLGWSQRRNLWMGVLCATGCGWLVLACMNWAVFEIYAVVTAPAFPTEYAVLVGIAATLMFIVTLVLTSFIAGAVCAFFWHPFASRKFYAHWSFPIIFALFVPIGWMANDMACCVLFFGFLLASTSQKGFDFGLKWWPQQRGWRQFFGLSNDWGRDDETKLP